jgi:hypothetical protein
MQREFVELVCEYLDDLGFVARTLGVTDYDTGAPLKAVRRLLLESNGLVTVAFRRTQIVHGLTVKPNGSDNVEPTKISNAHMTTAWPHIETAMAFQAGLPILVLRERGVIADGVLEPGVIGTYTPEFNLEVLDPEDLRKYFKQPMWQDSIKRWEKHVRDVVETKSTPIPLYAR